MAVASLTKDADVFTAASLGSNSACETSQVYLFELRLNVPVNNFSVMSGRSQRFLGLTITVGS